MAEFARTTGLERNTLLEYPVRVNHFCVETYARTEKQNAFYSFKVVEFSLTDDQLNNIKDNEELQWVSRSDLESGKAKNGEKIADVIET